VVGNPARDHCQASLRIAGRSCFLPRPRADQSARARQAESPSLGFIQIAGQKSDQKHLYRPIGCVGPGFPACHPCSAVYAVLPGLDETAFTDRVIWDPVNHPSHPRRVILLKSWCWQGQKDDRLESLSHAANRLCLWSLVTRHYVETRATGLKACPGREPAALNRHREAPPNHWRAFVPGAWLFGERARL